MAEYYNIGKLVGTHGLQGELLLVHELSKKTSLKGVQAIFIEENREAFIPWFIETTKIKGENEIYIKLEGINSREAAIKLAQKKVWLPDVDYRKFASKSSPANLLGYMIFDGTNQIGEIQEIIEQPHQLLCRTTVDGKEVYIPLHDDFLQKIDAKQKKVFLTLPDGLLDIYLT